MKILSDNCGEGERHMHAIKGKGKISQTLIAINTIPLLLLGFLIMLLSSHWFSKIMYAEIEVELKNAASGVITTLEFICPGDYKLAEDIGYELYKGEHNLTSDYTLIDHVKGDTGFEVTLFYQDTRVLTTIRNSSGQRIIGTGAPETVIQEVLLGGDACFYNNAVINGSGYFSYYLPLHNSDGTIVGMLFVGKPKKSVDASIQHAVYPLLIVDILAALAVAVINFIYNKGFVSALLKIHGFLSEVSSGNLSAKLDTTVLGRNDELSEIGYSALNMQRSLFTMIEQDSLTELFNRRSGDRKLRKVIAHSAAHKIPFCVAIGDIDFFKRVNDTYGHECGDLVLKNVASCLRQHMYSKGFAARWGGEEFLLVYEHMSIQDAHAQLESLLHEIQEMKCCFEGQTVSITMTFGLAEGNGDDITRLLRNADNRLYQGKALGRNRIIC